MLPGARLELSGDHTLPRLITTHGHRGVVPTPGPRSIQSTDRIRHAFGNDCIIYVYNLYIEQQFCDERHSFEKTGYCQTKMAYSFKPE